MTDKLLLSNIRSARESMNIKQEYIAEKLGVSPATYSKVENGKVRLTAQRLQQIASIIGVSLLQLTVGKHDRQLNANELKQELGCAKAQIAELHQVCTQQTEREKSLLAYIQLLEKQLSALPK